MNTTQTTEAETMTTEQTRAKLIQIADEQMSAYPQYRGHFDGYSVGRVKKALRTKCGLAFEAGELVIFVEKKSFFPTYGFRFVTAYSSRNRIDTSIPASDIEALS